MGGPRAARTEIGSWCGAAVPREEALRRVAELVMAAAPGIGANNAYHAG